MIENGDLQTFPLLFQHEVFLIDLGKSRKFPHETSQSNIPFFKVFPLTVPVDTGSPQSLALVFACFHMFLINIDKSFVV